MAICGIDGFGRGNGTASTAATSPSPAVGTSAYSNGRAWLASGDRMICQISGSNTMPGLGSTAWADAVNANAMAAAALIGRICPAPSPDAAGGCRPSQVFY